jgi:mannan endo-1,4-beta-mannosidase
VQTAPGVFKESTFKGLDYVLHTAAKNDVRLLLPFINYWEEFGGREVRGYSES